MVIKAVDKIRQYYHENGLSKSALWVTSKSLKSFVTAFVNPRTCYIIEKLLEDKLPNMKAKLDVTFRSGCIEDFESFQYELRPWRRFRKIFSDRFRNGKTCIVCLRQSQAIGYIWITDLTETDKNLGITIRPKNDESYGFDLYVLPEYRKHLVGYELISHWLHQAQEEGKRKAIGIVASYNHPMLMTTKLVFGFKKTKEVRSIEFFRRRGFVIQERDLP